MSKGLGRIQRRILDALKYEADNPKGTVTQIPTALLTVLVFMDDEKLAEYRTFDRDIQFMTIALRRVDPWKRNTVSRACRRLWQDGHIEAFTAKGSTATWWALPQAKNPRRKPN